VEFMLTTLRTKLKGVGSLEVMGAVNERAIAYYGDQQVLGTMTDDSLERRARILHAMGEDDVTRGDMARALASFREAHRVTQAILARHPDDAKTIFAHAQSDYWIGRVHELRQEWSKAGRQYARYAAAGKRLLAIAPNNVDYMMERGWGELSLSHVELGGAKDPVAAEILIRRAIAWFAKAARSQSENSAALREEANAYAYLSDSFYVRKLWPEALDARRREHAINLRLHQADPDDADKVYVLAISERAVAKVSARLNPQNLDHNLLRAAYGRSLWLSRRDPNNDEWLLFKTKIECDLLANEDTEKMSAGYTQLRNRIVEAHSMLRAHRNPRISEISLCLNSVGQNNIL